MTTFYRVSAGDPNSKKVISLVNPEEVLEPNARLIGPPNPTRGFGDWFKKMPVFQLPYAPGESLFDCNPFHAYWFVSSKLKEVFEKLDPKGVEFAECATVFTEGTAGPVYWLCDVLRELDAIDEPASDIRVYEESSQYKYYGLKPNPKLKIIDDAVADARVFRLKYARSTILCEELLRSACKTSSVKGLYFQRV